MHTPLDLPFLDQLRRTPDGLVPAIVQDADNGEVLMLAWMNDEAIRLTLQTRQAHFYSRSRQSLWHKGGTSSHVQHLIDIRVDCDADVLLLLVHQVGGACHEGYRTCFYRRVTSKGTLDTLDTPVFDPATVYRP